MKSYVTAMKRYFAFSGRSSRKEFWLFILFVTLEMVIALAIGGMAGSDALGSALAGLVALVHLVPVLAVQVRRLHDINRSGWWILVQVIPLGQLVALVMYCLPSTQGTNRFGSDPREGATPTAAPVKNTASTASTDTTVAQIEKLSKMKESGAISEDEFQRLKAEALGQGAPAQ